MQEQGQDVRGHGMVRFPRLTFLALAIKLTQYASIATLASERAEFAQAPRFAYGGRLGRHAGRASVRSREI